MTRIGVAAACLILIPVAAGAGEEGGAPGLRRRADYFGLWPFFSRETFEDGSTNLSSLAGLVKAETEPDGDWHHHVLPFYCASLWHGRTDRQLGLYPLLYLRRRSPEKDHDALLPLFWRWRTGASEHTLFWPLFHAARDPKPAPFRWVPALFRHGSWPGEEASRQRLGLPVLLELLEHKRTQERDVWTFLNFLNFDEETRSGLPLGKLSFSGEASHAHLFPLFSWSRDGDGARVVTPLAAVWRKRERRGLALPPLLTWATWSPEGHGVHALLSLFAHRREGEDWLLRALPFYAASGTERRRYRFYSAFYGRIEDRERARTDHYYPLLLSHHGADPSGFDLDVLWPLGHYSRRDGDAPGFAVRALPFFDRKRSPEGEWLGVGGFLYRRHEGTAASSLSQWAPWPLVHWSRLQSGRQSWVLPFFFHRDRATESLDTNSTFVAPSIFVGSRCKRSQDDAGKLEERSQSFTFFPFWSRTETRRLREKPGSEPRLDSEQWKYASLNVHFERSIGHADPPRTAAELNVIPLIHYRWDKQAADFVLVPLFYAGNAPARSYTYLYPLAAVEHGSGAKRHFWHATSIFQWYAGEHERYFNVFPLLFRWGKKSDGDGWFHLIPLGFGSWSEKKLHFGIFPLYYHRDSGPAEVNYWDAGRFFFLWNTLASDEKSHWSLLWKAIEGTRARSGDSEFRILHRLFVNRAVQGQRELVLNPLFQYFADERTGRRSFSILKFVYSHDVDGDRATARVFFIPVWRSAGGRNGSS